MPSTPGGRDEPARVGGTPERTAPPSSPEPVRRQPPDPIGPHGSRGQPPNKNLPPTALGLGPEEPDPIIEHYRSLGLQISVDPDTGYLVATMWVALTEMFIAPYGRQPTDRKVDKMLSRGLDRDALGTISLSLRPDGRFAIIDGGHRAEAAAKSGLTHLFARVYLDLTYEQEAELYEKLGTVNRQTALDRFRARVEAKEPTALHIQEILARHSMKVSISGPAVGSVQSIGAIDKIYIELGPVALDAIVGILYRAWGTTRKAWVQNMMEAMRQFWMRYSDEVNVDKLVAQLRLTSPERLMAEAGAVVVHTSSPGTLIGQTIVIHYNKGVRTNKLGYWVDHIGKTREARQRVADQIARRQ